MSHNSAHGYTVRVDENGGEGRGEGLENNGKT